MNTYFMSLKISFMDSLEYKLDFLLTILYAFFPIIIQVFIWKNVFALSDGGTMFGYDFNQLVCYAILSNFVNSFVSTGIHSEVSNDIKSGDLNKYIIKPMNYIGYRMAGAFGKKITEMIFLGVLSIVVFVSLFKLSGFEVDLLHILLFWVLLVFSLLLNFFLYLSISFLTFWIVDCSSLYGTVSIIISVISGAIFPLDIFGETFMKISNWLPFKYLVYIPLKFVVGEIVIEQVHKVFLIQSIWICIFFFICKLLWSKGLKKYSGIGG